jgi:opacity protein-like surface antigen
MWKKTLLIVGLIILMGARINAQSLSLGPQGGYYKAQDADEGSFIGGVVGRFKLMPMLGIEASISYRQEKYVDNLVTVRSWPVMVSGLIYPHPIFYGAMGFGWYNTTFDYDQDRLPLLKDDTVQKIGWHFGGGVELPVSSNFTLTGDLRYVFLDYDFQGIPGSDELKSNFFVITVGLLYGLESSGRSARHAR